jgi:4-carboxymuconolactone decarboxylase
MTPGAARPLAGKSAVGQAVVDDARYQRGLAQLEAVSGSHGTKVVQSLEDIAPNLGR